MRKILLASILLTFCANIFGQTGSPDYAFTNYYDFTGGLNVSKAPHLIADNETPYSVNAVLDNSYLLTKRPGYSILNNQLISEFPIFGIHRYYKNDGTKKLIVASNSNLLVYDEHGQFNSIQPGLRTAADNQWRFVTYTDRLFGFNGYDDARVYDGTYDYTCGITAPASACTATQVDSGSMSAGTYLYKYTYYDTNTGTESNPSPVASVTIVASKKVELTNILNSGTTDRSISLKKKIYRTEMDGGTYYYLATNGATDTDYTDNTTDADLSSTLMPTTNDKPLKMKDVVVYKGQLIGCGNPDFPSRVYFSSLLGTQGPECWDPLAYVDVDSNDGTIIQRIMPLGDDVIVFKEKAMYRLVGGAWTSTDLPIVRPIASSTGTCAPWSVVDCNGVLVYLSRIADKPTFYMFDGHLQHRIGPKIEDEMTNMVAGKVKYATGSYYDKKYRLAYQDTRSGGYNCNNRVLEFDIPTQSWWPLDGLWINCWSYWGAGNDTGELYYGDARLGFVCQYGIVARDPGLTEIPLVYRTKSFVGGHPQIHKRYRELYIDFAKGFKNSLLLRFIFDYGKDSLEKIIDLTEYVGGDWDIDNWDEFYWAEKGPLQHKIVALDKRAVSRYVAVEIEDK